MDRGVPLDGVKSTLYKGGPVMFPLALSVRLRAAQEDSVMPIVTAV